MKLKVPSVRNMEGGPEGNETQVRESSYLVVVDVGARSAECWDQGCGCGIKRRTQMERADIKETETVQFAGCVEGKSEKEYLE